MWKDVTTERSLTVLRFYVNVNELANFKSLFMWKLYLSKSLKWVSSDYINNLPGLDISADLTELGRTPIAVVSAGVKSILDIGRTLEFLVRHFYTVFNCPPQNLVWQA